MAQRHGAQEARCAIAPGSVGYRTRADLVTIAPSGQQGGQEVAG